MSEFVACLCRGLSPSCRRCEGTGHVQPDFRASVKAAAPGLNGTSGTATRRRPPKDDAGRRAGAVSGPRPLQCPSCGEHPADYADHLKRRHGINWRSLSAAEGASIARLFVEFHDHRFEPCPLCGVRIQKRLHFSHWMAHQAVAKKGKEAESKKSSAQKSAAPQIREVKARTPQAVQPPSAGPQGVRCPHCKASLRPDRLDRHLRRVHGETAISDPSRKPKSNPTVKCTLCKNAYPLSVMWKHFKTEHPSVAAQVAAKSVAFNSLYGTEAKRCDPRPIQESGTSATADATPGLSLESPPSAAVPPPTTPARPLSDLIVCIQCSGLIKRSDFARHILDKHPRLASFIGSDGQLPKELYRPWE